MLYNRVNSERKSSEVVFVLGARRSGTNYLERLILSNFSCKVANLNNSVSAALKNDVRRPWLYNLVGLKHSTGALTKTRDLELRSLVIVREPASWLDARTRYAIKYMGMSRNEALLSAPAWIENEYNSFYAEAIRLNHVVVKYEELVKDPLVIRRYFSGSINIMQRFRGFENVSYEIMPGGGKGPVFRKKIGVLSQQELDKLIVLFDDKLLV